MEETPKMTLAGWICCGVALVALAGYYALKAFCWCLGACICLVKHGNLKAANMDHYISRV